MVTEYNPQSERGAGIALPITKAIGHVMNIHTAISREWPLTLEEAAAELNEAEYHLGDTVISENLLSENGYNEFSNYSEFLSNLIATLSNTISALGTPEEQITTEHIAVTTLQDIIQRSWMLLCAVDYELAGLSGVQNDPGRLP